MRIILIALLLLIFATPVFAGGEDFLDQYGDIITGKDNCYLKGEAVKEIVLNRPFFGLDRIQIGLYTKVELGQTALDRRYIEGGPTVKLIW